MVREFRQWDWCDELADDCRQLVRLAVREDIDRWCDMTSVALVPPSARGRAAIVARREGVVAGLPAARLTLEEMNIEAEWRPLAADGNRVDAGAPLVEIASSARDLLTAERILLNLLGRMCGVATLTARYVAELQGTPARLYDTRKTTPGWRKLEKYAVRCGGGHNHRTGLFDAILIKDNHLAYGAFAQQGERFAPAAALAKARDFLNQLPTGDVRRDMMVEIEVDSLGQLREVLPERPDVVLLDNMSCEQLVQAVAMRNEMAPQVELEASGGISLATLRGVAETGVDRISSGALTHSAVSLDVALDWRA